MSDAGTVNITKQGHVAVIEFDRPPNNHASADLLTRIADAFEAQDADKDVRALVLCSVGKNFCAGADFTGGSTANSEVAQFYVQAERLFAAKKPVVCAVQGAAVGAGLGVALVGDFRVAGHDARFAANFVKLGFHPGFGITHTLPRLIGAQKASLVLLTGRRFKADEALAMGLADVVAEDPRAGAIALAEEIAENAPLAVQATRTTLRGELAAAVKAQTEHELKEQTWLRATADFAEGVKAVTERRPGKFTGT
jgi:enoyl-CoA hydratase/carnithine racemase